MLSSRRSRALLYLLCFFTAFTSACASIPKGQYGVTEIEWQGVEDMNSEALESCLVTRKRESWHVRLGISSPSCGKPPFDWSAPDIKILTLPWTEWPIYDPAIFEVERQRIERWYQARGYYDARVLRVQTHMDGKEVKADEECPPDASCKLTVRVAVAEGKPTHIDDVRIVSSTPLPEGMLDKMREGLELHRGMRFDEASYTADKEMLEDHLIRASYARAKVSGKVSVNRAVRQAQVEYRIEPGPTCKFGKVTVEGAEDVPEQLILQTANIKEGATYDQNDVDDAERSLFALRVYSSVRIERAGEGEVVDLVIRLQRGRITTWSAGVGVMSGTLRRDTSATQDDTVPQWDVHLRGSYENRNLFGGLRYFRIEERPRLIFQNNFPGVKEPRFGNLIGLKFEQPATFERRTVLFSNADWDVGPDPYRGYFRHDIRLKVGLRRSFWLRRITASLAVEQDFYVPTVDSPPSDVSNYTLPFLEQQLILDLRDDARRPRLGVYASIVAQEAFTFGNYGSWDYLRVLPDVRVYFPLFLDIVVAARFAIGGLWVLGTNGKLDPNSAELGPVPYRLRGGGANSNRGFLPGLLGYDEDFRAMSPPDMMQNPTLFSRKDFPGGSRRWEGSIELRIPLGSDFGITLFGDIGDVATSFRWSHLNTSAGFGLRYHTIVGALRLDAGWRIPGLQVINGLEPPKGTTYRTGALPSAVHLTIGEAF